METKKKKVLGRGLGNLLDDSPSAKRAKANAGITNVPLDKIRVNPDNPRKKFLKTAIQGLASTIKTHGLLQPILVRPEGEHFRLISGERRLRACRELKLKTIPAIVKEFKSHDVQEVSLIENIQREQLDAIEEAAALKAILDSKEMTQEELASRVGKSRAAIANRVRLLNLPFNIQAEIADGKLSEGHVRPLLAIKSEALQSKLCDKIIREELNARQIEDLVRNYTGKAIKKTKAVDKVSADLKALILDLEKTLSLRVKINHNSKAQKGKLTIEYFNLDDLDKVVNKLKNR